MVRSRPRSLSSAAALGLVLCAVACGGSTPPPRPSPPPSASAPPPSGPTRTDFKEISRDLVRRCVGGGWISRWRAEGDIDAAKPRIRLEPFSDQTGQGLDPTYLTSELERQMRTSGVFEMVSDDARDFDGRGKLLRLAERGKGGARISVYTAILELVNPKTGKLAYSCEATVQGEL
jgi:hypothetical protein